MLGRVRAPSRTAVVAVSVLVGAGLALASCGGPPTRAGSTTAASTGPVGDGATSAAAPRTGAAPSSRAPTTPPPTSTAPDVPTPDVLAGLLSQAIPDAGDGSPVVVPGSAPAPGPGTDEVTVAVSVEGGLPAAGEAFAAFVLATLNDPRGWPREGYTFSRTDDPATADVTVVLASPSLTDQLCRPLVTYGKLSCRNGNRSVLTWYRWVQGIPEYADDLTAYRRYLVNHEVGHFLGNGHASCPAAGAPAPVMMQQTKGLQGCAPNPWPYP